MSAGNGSRQLALTDTHFHTSEEAHCFSADMKVTLKRSYDEIFII